MNIFQQVFANANSNKPATNNTLFGQSQEQDQIQVALKPKNDTTISRPTTKTNSNQATTATVSFDLKNININNIQNTKKEVTNQTIEKKSTTVNVNANYKKKKESQAESSLKNKLEAIQKRVADMEIKLKQKQEDLKGLKEKNEQLKLQKQEKEIYIEKMNAATDELNKKIIQMQDDFDQEDEEKNKYWEFRYMELKFQIETMKEESVQ